MKNKKLLIAGVLAAFLMLAVPFAVIFDADDSDATSYTVVGNWDQLETAINNSEISAIKFVDNIVYESDTEGEYGLQITRSMEIDGNGYSLSRTTTSGSDWKFVNITGMASGTVTIKGLTIDFAGGNYSRSINVSNSQNITLNIFNTKVSNGTHYPVNITPSCTNVNLIINETELNSEDGDIKGYCALNIWGTGHTITITNSTLVGNNIHQYHETNSFSTIMINRDSSADITIIDSDIKTLSVNGNEQRAVYFNTESNGSLKISGDSTVEMDAPGYAMVFLNEGIDVDLESLTLTTTKNENLIYTKSDIEFGSGFKTNKLLEVAVCSDVNLIGNPNNSFHGLTVENYDGGDYDVVIDGINSTGSGIFVNGLKEVDIRNCVVSTVNSKVDSQVIYGNYGGIGVWNATDVTVTGNVLSDITADNAGVGIVLHTISGMIELSGNTIKTTYNNALWIQAIGGDLIISGNDISEWNYTNRDAGGRAIRANGVHSVSVSSNNFEKSYDSDGIDDVGNLFKVDGITAGSSVSFYGNSLNDDGIPVNVRDMPATSGEGFFFDANVKVKEDSHSTIDIDSGNYYWYNIDVSGSFPSDAEDVELNIYGELNIESEGSVVADVINLEENAVLRNSGLLEYTTSIASESAKVYFNEGSTVTTPEGTKTYEENVKYDVLTGIAVSSINVDLYASHASLSKHSIEVFVGDLYLPALLEVDVSESYGYEFVGWFTELGTQITEVTVVSEEITSLTARCMISEFPGEYEPSLPITSDDEESSGFDIADHVVLIEAVIAVIVLIGFVAYIRKN